MLKTCLDFGGDADAETVFKIFFITVLINYNVGVGLWRRSELVECSNYLCTFKFIIIEIKCNTRTIRSE